VHPASRLVKLSLAVLSLLGAGAAHAQELHPFTQVQTIGEDKLPWDKVVLKDGKEIKAKLVAETPAFYVLERFSEYRAVGRDQVTSLEKNPAVKRPLTITDVILLQNGHVLVGHIVQEREDGMYEMRQPSDRFSVYAWKKAIASIYKAGVQVYPPPAAAPAAPKP
jgi:hypothetical protein